jgi:hypothetical protein
LKGLRNWDGKKLLLFGQLTLESIEGWFTWGDLLLVRFQLEVAKQCVCSFQHDGLSIILAGIFT